MSKKTIKKLKRVQSLFLSVLIVFSMMTSSSLTVVDATEDEVINEIDETEETSTSEETVFEEVEEVQPTPEVKEEIPEEVVDEATQEEEVVIDDVPIDETVEEPQPTGTEEEIPEVVETPTEIVEETEEKPVEKPVEKDVKKAPAENTQRGARTDSSVAQIGDEFYDSLSAAVIAAEDGDTIVMIADSTESSENTLIAKKVTIDLAGHTITKPGFYEIEADVVVKDTSADHHGVIDAGFSVLKGEYGSQFTVESGTLTNASREVVTIHNSCQLVVGQNASILATGDNYAITTSDRVGFTVAEIYGTVKAKSIAVFVGTAHVYEGASITSETSTAILSRSSANTVSTTFINGGTIQGKIGLELDNAQGLQTIKSGEIIGEQYGVYIRNGNLSTALFTEASSAIIKATAGTSIAFDSNASENATATIYGGYFSDDAANDNRFVRDGGKYLSKGADPNYPDLYALTDHNVAKNATSNRYYLSLQEAINEANEGDSIELLKDHAENVSVNRSIQFDAKEYTLSNDGSNTNNGITLSVSGNTEFTFVGGTITTDRSNRAAVLVSGAASIQMRGGNITNTNTNNTMAALRINGTGNSTITGGTIISESNNQYGPAVSSANGSLTISGETYIEGKGVAAALYAGNPGGNDDGSITVDGGTIKNSGTGVAAYVNRGTMTINGGTIESVTANKSVGTASNGTFNINGGYYSDVAGNGDAFNRKDNYKLMEAEDKPGYYALRQGVVQIGDVQYPSLQAAFRNAQDGDVIEVIADYTESRDVLLQNHNFDITIDLNGHTVTKPGIISICVDSDYLSGGPLHIKDSSEEKTGRLHFTADEGNEYGIIVNARYVEIQSGTISADTPSVIYCPTPDSSSISALRLRENGKIIANGEGPAIYGRGNLTIEGTIEAKADAISVSGSAQVTVNATAHITSETGTAITIGGTDSASPYSDAHIEMKGGFVQGERGILATRGNNTITAGEVTGSEYGVYAQGGTMTINGGVFTATNGPSVKKSSESTFKINGGYFSDTAGNEDGFTLPLHHELMLSDDMEGYYELYSAVAYNVDTDTYYAEFARAIDEVQDGQTIRLIDDLIKTSSDGYFRIQDRNFTLDLNGYTISSAATVGDTHHQDQMRGTLYVRNATLTITDSSEDGTGKIANVSNQTGAMAIYVYQGGNLTVEKGLIEAVGHGGYGIFLRSTLNNNNRITINGGHLKASISPLVLESDNLGTINGGIIERVDVGYDDQYSSYDYDRIGSVHVDGGGDDRCRINGGYFSDDAGNNDTYFIRPENAQLIASETMPGFYELGFAIASINGTPYQSLYDATIAAQDGDTIIMLSDSDETQQIIINKNITLDLNNRTVNMAKTFNVVDEFIIKDASDNRNGTINFGANASILVNTNQGNLTIEHAKLNGLNTSVINVAGGSATINHGEIILSSDAAPTILVGSQGNIRLDVNGGTIKNDAGTAIESHGNRNSDVLVNINGGSILGVDTVKATGYGKVNVGFGDIIGTTSAVKAEQNANVTINGGTLNALEGESVVNTSSNPFILNGGYYSDRAGLNEGFTLPEGKTLIGSDAKQGFYEIGDASECTAEIVETDVVYKRLQDALNQVQDNQTIRMLKDVDTYQNEPVYGNAFEIDRAVTFTLDLNGKTIEGTGVERTTMYVRQATMTITDSSEDESGLIINTPNRQEPTGTIHPVNAAVILEKGTISGGDYNNAIYATENSHVTINGGKVTSKTNQTVFVAYGATFTMNDGEIISEESNGIYVDSGKTIIDDGSITAHEYTIYQKNDNEASTEIHGGIFTSDGNTLKCDGQSFIINGGFFSDDVGNAAFFTKPEGMSLQESPNMEGYFELQETPHVRIGQKGYRSLAAALEEAQDGDKLVVFNDYEEPEGNLIVDKAVIIDLAGYTVTKNGGITIQNDVTIQDTKEVESGSFNFTGSEGLIVTDNGKLIVNDGGIKNTAGGIAITVEGGTANINGGTIEGKTGIHVGSNSDVLITGGEITGTQSAITATDGTVTINDGIIQSSDGTTFIRQGNARVDIEGGAYSDDAGNAEGFIRKDDMLLLKDDDQMYRLSGAIAENEETGERYNNLQEAFDAARENETVFLLRNINEEAVFVNNPFTFDLNGKTITSIAERTIIVKDTFTIIDSSETDTNAGSGFIESTMGSAIVVMEEGSEFTLESGLLKANLYGIEAQGGTTAIVNGGKVHGDQYGIYDLGTIIVNDGHITGGEVAAYSNANTITINDGYIGELDSDIPSVGLGDNGKIEINGGHFSDEIGNEDAYIRANNKKLLDLDNDGWFELSGVVASITNAETGETTYYESLQDAFNAAQNGETVDVLTDISLKDPVRLSDKVITLNVGSHTIENDPEADSIDMGLIRLTGQDGITTGLTITGNEDGKIQATTGNAIYMSGIRRDHTHVNLTVDTITIEAKYEAIYSSQLTSITINPGTILHSEESSSVGGLRATIHGHEANITINGGTIKNDTGTAISLGSGTGRVTINDGVIDAGDKTFDVAEPDDVRIYGGKFSDDIANGEGYFRDDDQILWDEDGDGFYELGHVVASITRGENTIQFDSLQKAFDAAQDGETVNVLKDISLKDPVRLSDKVITLNVGSHTIKDDPEADSIDMGLIRLSGQDGITTGLTITGNDDGKIQATTGNAIYMSGIRRDHSHVNLTVDTITIKAKNEAIYSSQYTSITINSGTLHSEESSSVGGLRATIHGHEAWININGGTIKNDTGTAISLGSGTGKVIINNGVIDAGDKTFDVVEPDDVTINGGRFSDSIGNGERFIRPEGQFLLDADQDGWYELGSAVASITNEETGETTYYATLQEAFNAAQNGDTVDVLTNISLKDPVRLSDKVITLNVGSHTIKDDPEADSIDMGLIRLTGQDGITTGLTITGTDDGKIQATTGNAIYMSGIRRDHSHVNLIVDTITIKAKNEAIYSSQYTSITINSGTLHSEESSSVGGLRATIHGHEAWITINGGTIKNDTGTAISLGSGTGTVTINDGVIQAGDKTFDVYDPTHVEIKGGVYSDDIANGEGYKRKDSKVLELGANSAYPTMYALDIPVASIERDGTTHYYASLAAAVNDARSGETITMVADDQLASPVSILKEVTIDLNGKKVIGNFNGTGAINLPYQFPNKPNVTIKDTSENGDGEIRNDNNRGYGIEAQSQTTLTIESGNVYGGDTGVNISSPYANTTIKGGTVEGRLFGVQIAGGNLTVDGGTIHGTSGGIVGGLADPKPTIIISGGDISSDDTNESYRGIYLRGGKVEVEGGKISGGTGIAITTFNWGSSDQVSSAKVNGGEISGTFKSISSTNTITDVDPAAFEINGGKFSDTVGNGEDYTRKDDQMLMDEEGDGWYELATPVASVTRDEETILYSSLQKAFDAAQDGETVDVLTDITLTDHVNLQNKEITLNVGSHTIKNDPTLNTANTGLIWLTQSDRNTTGLTITGNEDGKIQSTTGNVILMNGITRDHSHVKLTVNTIIIDAKYDAIFATQETSITINSGTLHSEESSSVGERRATIHGGEATITINGGTIKNDNGTAISLVSGTGTVEINDGVIDANGDTFDVYDPTHVTIKGGVYSDDIANGDGYQRWEGQRLVKGANSEYPEMYALAVDKTALENAITAATEDKNNTPVSADGKDLKDGTEYVDQATQNALNEAIEAAQAVFDDPDVTQADVDNATQAMNEAKQAFDDAKKTASVDKTLLEDAIDSATEDKDSTPVSADGKDLKDGTEYVDQATQDALTQAIAAAQAVVDNPNATQNDVDAAKEALDAAKQEFDNAKKTANVDKTALNNAITAATTDKNNTPVSKDGKDLIHGTKYVDQATQDALDEAIEAAQAVVDDPNATQNDVDAAKVALDAAKQEFDDAKQTASVDKTALNQSITAAITDKNNTPVSEDGKDLKDGTEYVDQDTQDALNDAIEAAQEVFDNPNATQNEVDAAKAAIDEAKQAFDDAKKTATVDKTPLEEAIDSATEDKDNTPVSEDGKDQPDGTKYVDQATQDALTQAIATAQAVANDSDATQNDVDAAKEALEAAKQAFDDAKKTASVDKTPLEEAIDSATEDKDSTPVSEDGEDLKDGTEYVDQTTQDELDDAIKAAQDVLDDPNATQNDVDAATQALNDAKQEFDDAKKKATVDKTALNQAITAATDDKDSTPVSEDGKDQPDGTEYVNQAAQDALDEAIAAAQEVLDDPDATQNDVDRAREAIEQAKYEFDESKQLANVDKSALETALNDAIDPNEVNESADGSDIPVGQKWATPEDKAAYEEALKKAKEVLADPNVTQNDVDAALEALEEAQKKIQDGTKEEEDQPVIDPILYEIIFDPNGGTMDSSPNPTSAFYEEGTVITIVDAPVREGYKFLYWQGSKYYPGDTYTVVEDHKFTAIWEKVEDKTKPDSDSKPDSKTNPSPTPNKKDGGKAPANTNDANDLMLWVLFLLGSIYTMVFSLRRRSQ